MRIIFISDTHSLHEELPFNLGDFINENDENILIHSGDCTNIGTYKELNDFVVWYSKIKGFDKKIFIGGNHDFALEDSLLPYHRNAPPEIQIILNPENLDKHGVVYLQDSNFIINSKSLNGHLKFYGTPWQPEFGGWGFNLPRLGNELQQKWNEIPNDVHILISHGPPFGFRDKLLSGESVGCELLRNKVLEIKPFISVFGHIHNGYGAEETNNTLFINASICDEGYIPSNRPIVVDVTTVDGILKYELK